MSIHCPVPEPRVASPTQSTFGMTSRFEEIVGRARPEVVYHLAAVSFGPDARRDVHQALAVTALGTANLLHACATIESPPFVLVVSSSEVYGPLDQRPIRESDPAASSNAVWRDQTGPGSGGAHV